ncbi:putative oxidoreductase [Acrodontium crateriforme]|uniref:Oxidoreductase n=1 Tax=Acrodontium crateriforme TaxID=150365 RepID=A0AAQ3RBI5_9PEZI|nr:putative oxidoreductase [Acrodontium crateriforme]
MFPWFVVLSSFLSLALGDLAVLDNNAEYNDGRFGPYVTQSYRSSDVNSPRLNFMKPFTSCDDGSFLFVAPRGGKAGSKPYILDAKGHLIWTADHHYGEVYNFQAQVYKGQQYLTFFAGDDTIRGHGAGKYYMIDQHYNEFRQIHAANGVKGDLHEFQIIDGKTALITAYHVVEAKLGDTEHEGRDGYIWESLFQEIDIETGEAVFEWRASEHVKLSESFDPIGSRGSEGDPWDFFHINSVDKDLNNNYLVSSRYLRSILYISGTTGEVLWHLGGKENSFTDESDPGQDALHFVGQHHARWTDNYNSITFFDNRADWTSQEDVKSAGTKILVDTELKTVAVDRVYVNPIHDVLSTSQGSLQTLPNGNILLGYGFNAVITEFSPHGEVLCDAYIGEPSSRFGTGDVQSYRNFKFNWTGLPTTEPSFRLINGTFFTSWLGSTEVRSWSLRHAFDEDRTYDDLALFPKEGFETRLELSAGQNIRRYVAIVALDQYGKDLAWSKTIDISKDVDFWLTRGIVDAASYDAEYSSDGRDREVDFEWLSIRDSMILSVLGFAVTLTGAIVWLLSTQKKEERADTADIEQCSYHHAECKPMGVMWKIQSLLSSKLKRISYEHEHIALLEPESVEPDEASEWSVATDRGAAV